MSPVVPGELAFGVHLSGSVLFALAMLPNWLLALFLRCRQQHRSTPVNTAVCLQALANGVYCLTLSLYCLMKTAQYSPPTFGHNDQFLTDNRPGCLVMTGVSLLFIHAPNWSLLLLSAVTALVWSSGDNVIAHRWLPTKRMLQLRLAAVALDIVVAGWVLLQINNKNLMDGTECSLQLMIHRSHVFVIYTMFQLLSIAAVGSLSTAVILHKLSQTSASNRSQLTTRQLLRWSLLVVGALSLVIAVTLNTFFCLSPRSRPSTVLVSAILSSAFVLLLMPFLILLAHSRLVMVIKDTWKTSRAVTASTDKLTLGNNGGGHRWAAESDDIEVRSYPIEIVTEHQIPPVAAIRHIDEHPSVCMPTTQLAEQSVLCRNSEETRTDGTHRDTVQLPPWTDRGERNNNELLLHKLNGTDDSAQSSCDVHVILTPNDGGLTYQVIADVHATVEGILCA